jgi:hypothetical protein
MLIYVSEVMGMGTELSLVLGIMGTVWTGNPLSLNPGFSIGGPPPPASDLLGSLTGFLTGMSSIIDSCKQFHTHHPQVRLAVYKAPTTGSKPTPP